MFPRMPSLHRASLAAQKRSIWLHGVSQAQRTFLHRPDQAQMLVQLTNHVPAAFGILTLFGSLAQIVLGNFD